MAVWKTIKKIPIDTTKKRQRIVFNVEDRSFAEFVGMDETRPCIKELAKGVSKCIDGRVISIEFWEPDARIMPPKAGN